jgi:hypothetical protein
MTKRICYIHVGPHKTGTSSIQWFLRENRADLLNHGYFVPEAERRSGPHHALVEKLSGLEVGEHREPLVARSIQALLETECKAIVISSEALEGILANRKHADSFFGRIAQLNVKPKLVLFPRNQPQWINSSYASSVKGFRRSDPFQSWALHFSQSPRARFLRWTELADTYACELVAHPFTKQTVADGVIPQFLQTIGVNSSQFRDAAVRRNEGVGPFTVSVAREVLRSIAETGKPLTWLQATRSHRALAGYLRQKRLADAGYCGLSTELARRIEKEMRPDNDAFARQVWGRPWADVFNSDVGGEFEPNDFDVRPPDWSTRRRLRRVIREVKQIVHEILLDPALAVEAPWNDVRLRSGLVPVN